MTTDESGDTTRRFFFRIERSRRTVYVRDRTTVTCASAEKNEERAHNLCVTDKSILERTVAHGPKLIPYTYVHTCNPRATRAASPSSQSIRS